MGGPKRDGLDGEDIARSSLCGVDGRRATDDRQVARLPAKVVGDFIDARNARRRRLSCGVFAI